MDKFQRDQGITARFVADDQDVSLSPRVCTELAANCTGSSGERPQAQRSPQGIGYLRPREWALQAVVWRMMGADSDLPEFVALRSSILVQVPFDSQGTCPRDRWRTHDRIKSGIGCSIRDLGARDPQWKNRQRQLTLSSRMTTPSFGRVCASCSKLQPELRVVGEAADGEETVRVVRQT